MKDFFKYIKLVKKILKNYGSGHFIIYYISGLAV